MTELFTDKTNLRNLLIMIYAWSTLAFGYFLVNFELKYLQGDIYKNAYTSSVAEIIAKLIGGIVLVKFGLKPIFAFCFTIACIGAVALIFVTDANDWIISMLVMGAKFGISMGWVGCYMGMILLFKTTLVGAAMGCCNVICRLAAMAAPLIAELDAPIPMITIGVLTIIGAVITQFISV